MVGAVGEAAGAVVTQVVAAIGEVAGGEGAVGHGGAAGIDTERGATVAGATGQRQAGQAKSALIDDEELRVIVAVKGDWSRRGTGVESGAPADRDRPPTRVGSRIRRE